MKSAASSPGIVLTLGKKLLFSNTLIPHEFSVALPDPQTEIAVWLCGMGAVREVTSRYTTACCGPLVICISFDKGEDLSTVHSRDLSLQFLANTDQKRLLGTIRLAFFKIIPLDTVDLALFIVTESKNYCLPNRLLWAHYAMQAYGQLRMIQKSENYMTLLEQRAAFVTFIRPHPIALVSLSGPAGANIFPMNLMGDLGHGYFGFALTMKRLARKLVERHRRIALSNVPISSCGVAYALTPNHRKEAADWDQLPFDRRTSPEFNIPFPGFATRIREMEVVQSMDLAVGNRKPSHKFFIARIVSDQRFSAELQANVIHGFYQRWRLRGQPEALKMSVEQDRLNKHGPVRRPTEVKKVRTAESPRSPTA
jgi:hypothetical protein